MRSVSFYFNDRLHEFGLYVLWIVDKVDMMRACNGSGEGWVGLITSSFIFRKQLGDEGFLLQAAHPQLQKEYIRSDVQGTHLIWWKNDECETGRRKENAGCIRSTEEIFTA